MSDSTRSEGAHEGALEDAQRLLRERAARYSRQTQRVERSTIDVVTFRRDSGRYAIPLRSLREIRPLRTLCPIPGSSAVVLGVFHYRGELVSAHDLSAFMGSSDADAPEWVLVVEHEHRRLGLVADEVYGVELVSEDERRPLPLTLGERRACFSALVGQSLLIDGATLFATAPFFRAV